MIGSSRGALKKLEDKEASKPVCTDGPRVSYQQAFNAYAKTWLSKAQDWITGLCAFCFLVYGCAGCGVYPLWSNAWLRMCKDGHEDDTDQTWEGGGHWRCGNCLEQWTWSTGGPRRAIVIGDLAGDEVFQAFIGSAKGGTAAEAARRAQCETQMAILKTASMLETLNGKEMTKENVLLGIKALNEKNAGQLGQMVKNQILLFQGSI